MSSSRRERLIFKKNLCPETTSAMFQEVFKWVLLNSLGIIVFAIRPANILDYSWFRFEWVWFFLCSLYDRRRYEDCNLVYFICMRIFRLPRFWIKWRVQQIIFCNANLSWRPWRKNITSAQSGFEDIYFLYDESSSDHRIRTCRAGQAWILHSKILNWRQNFCDFEFFSARSPNSFLQDHRDSAR